MMGVPVALVITHQGVGPPGCAAGVRASLDVVEDLLSVGWSDAEAAKAEGFGATDGIPKLLWRHVKREYLPV